MKRTVEVFVSWVEIHHCDYALEYCYWPRLQAHSTNRNAGLRVLYTEQLKAQLQKWLNTPRFYTKPNHGNEFLVKVKIPLEWAIILFEVAESANQLTHLRRLLLHIAGKVWDNYHIKLELQIRPSDESAESIEYHPYTFLP